MEIIDLTYEVVDLTDCIGVPVQVPVQRQSRQELLKDDCCICYEPMGKRKLIQLECEHVYHSKCLKKWSKKKMECPMDRKPFHFSTLNTKF